MMRTGLTNLAGVGGVIAGDVGCVSDGRLSVVKQQQMVGHINHRLLKSKPSDRT